MPPKVSPGTGAGTRRGCRDTVICVPLRGLTQQLLHHVVVACGQYQPRQPPAVDDVADQIDRVRLVVAQEVDQEIGLGCSRSEVNIGDEQSAELLRCGAGMVFVNTLRFASGCLGARFMQRACDGCD